MTLEFCCRLAQFEENDSGTVSLFYSQIQTVYIYIYIAHSHTRIRTLLYIFLLELMERMEHALDYLHQTNIHPCVETICPTPALPNPLEVLLSKLSIIQLHLLRPVLSVRHLSHGRIHF